jgi:hypothetical protein
VVRAFLYSACFTTVVLLAGCKPPPAAPQGLDDSTAYLIREFYSDDPTFQAGVQGFMDWYDDEGFALVGERATTSNTSAFVIGDLTEESLAGLPLDDELLIDPDHDTMGPRDLSQAKGVVSLAEMQCGWTVAESFLARPDQNQVFPDDFEGYDRTYLGDRAAFEGASASLEFDDVRDPLTPFADGWDAAPYDRTLLQTTNSVDPTRVLTADIEAYPMHLDLRHGEYEIDGEPLGTLAILTWIESAAWGSSGDSGLIQSYSIEINVERPDDVTLRMLAVWTEPHGGGIAPDSAMALNFAVNKSQDASDRLSAVCAGDEEVPPEP